MAYNCTNNRDEISAEGNHHGSYYLRCTAKDNTQLVRSNCDASFDRLNVGKAATCTAEGFEAFVHASLGGYGGRHDLGVDLNGDAEVVFKWNVKNGKVEGALAFNGKAAWLAMGLRNRAEDAGKYGMLGSKVIFGVSSQDTEFPNATGTIKEYKIHDKQTRFDFWNTPYAGDSTLDTTEMIEENCYMAMKFTTDAIFGEALNISSGTNQLVWSIRASTYMHVGKDSYHEGCNGEERTRYRGGGRKQPWIVDFQDTTRKTIGTPHPTAAPTADGEDGIGADSSGSVVFSNVFACLTAALVPTLAATLV